MQIYNENFTSAIANQDRKKRIGKTFLKSKYQRDAEYAESLAKWLQEQDWKRFVTLTTQYTLTIPSARRLNERFINRLRQEVFPSAKMFWVAEPFETKDGCHTHGVLTYNRDDIPPQADELSLLDESYQIVSAARKKGKRYRASFTN